MKAITTTFLLTISFAASTQTIMPLYPENKIPNSLAVPNGELMSVNKSGDTSYSKVSVPALEIFLPERDKANGTAIIICPGGGYTNLSYTWEGTKIAREFTKMGITAFVLKYRLPSDAYMKDKTIGPLQDAQMAIKTVRMQAKQWGIDTSKVGIAGFSAGGHLASTAGTHFNTPVIDNPEAVNLRPSFLILIYPVISFNDSLAHMGSRTRLIGENPSAEIIKRYSNEMQVTGNTPPTFIVHAGDDKTVKVANSVDFYMALLKNGVPAEMHIYPKGGHGFGIRSINAGHWMELCNDWMKER